MTKRNLEAQALVALDADEAGDPRARALLAPVLKAVRAHAVREGKNDYAERASDVAVGLHDAEWKWPFAGADDAYLNAVTSNEILDEIGLSPPTYQQDRLWEIVSGAWLKSFKRGYVGAHAAGEDKKRRERLETSPNRTSRKTPAQLDREIAEALRYRPRVARVLD
jgi:hypothetical protein